MGVVQTGRVKLDKLHVGDAAPGAPGHCYAISRRGIGIGGVEINLAASARCQNGVLRGDGDDFIAEAVERINAVAAIILQAQFPAGDQVNRHVIFQHRDVRMPQHARSEGFLYGVAGRIGRMNDAPAAMSAFPGEVITHIVGNISGKGNSLGY